jgi:predicted DNA-binding transcriptional regulator AlpA
MAISGDSNKSNEHRSSAHLIRLPEAAAITGLPLSLLRKSFMSEEKRPNNVPLPPPHKRIGRAIYILAERLPDWIEGLGDLRRRRKPLPSKTAKPGD